MKLYRLFYGEDIKQGIFRGETGNPPYSITDIRQRMMCNERFIDMLRNKLHAPRSYEFDLHEFENPSEDALFYFKKDFYFKYIELLEDFISTAKSLNIEVNVIEIELELIKEYRCVYQDENQMCIEIKN